MSSSLMLNCEQIVIRVVNGESIKNWEEVLATALPSGTQPDIRCSHCHGEIRVHKRHVNHGPRDHVEHLSRQDSESCRGGHYFNGEHRISSQPVT
jgi:hypothetical protein